MYSKQLSGKHMVMQELSICQIPSLNYETEVNQSSSRKAWLKRWCERKAGGSQWCYRALLP